VTKQRNKKKKEESVGTETKKVNTTPKIIISRTGNKKGTTQITLGTSSMMMKPLNREEVGVAIAE
jgi:hypothetical protein